MKSLYESILDDQETVINRMTDEIQYEAIERFLNTHLWPWTSPDTRMDPVKYKYSKDKDGFYIETEGYIRCTQNGNLDYKNFTEWEHSLDIYNKKWPETHKGNLCPKFRWKSHKGSVALADNLQNVESLEGIPNTPIDILFIPDMCGCRHGVIDISGKRIKKIRLHNAGKLTLIGNSKTKVDEIEWSRSYNSYRPIIKGFKCSKIHQEKSIFD